MAKLSTRCGNTKCRHYSPRGCKLFSGSAWQRCRLAKTITTNPKKQEQKNG